MIGTALKPLCSAAVIGASLTGVASAEPVFFCELTFSFSGPVNHSNGSTGTATVEVFFLQSGYTEAELNGIFINGVPGWSN